MSTEYVNKFHLANLLGEKAQAPTEFCNCYEQFQSVFDGAALGQFFSGTNPFPTSAQMVELPKGIGVNGFIVNGFINETSFLNANNLIFRWEKDTLGRKIPYLSTDGKKWIRINNLHIHSKHLIKYFIS